jgi:putative MATE family efflux protein
MTGDPQSQAAVVACSPMLARAVMPFAHVLHAPTLRAVVRLALPVVLANLLQTLVNVVDVFMAGRLGPLSVAAVGMATSVRLLILVVVMAVTAGAMALAAQAKGARDPLALQDVTRQTLLLSLVLALAVSVLGAAVARPMMTFLNGGGPAEVVAAGSAYLTILFAGTVLLVAQMALTSLMQGAGDTVTPLWLAGATNAANVLFNWLFMFGPGPFPALGVPGAAVGTLLARALGLALALLVIGAGANVIRWPAGRWRWNGARIRDLLAIGVPSGLQSLAYVAAGFLVVRAVTATDSGSYGAAAMAIGLQIESFAFMPGVAISVAATSLVGQALGAWQPQQAWRSGHAALATALGLMGAVGLALFVFAEPLVRSFDPSAHPIVVADGAAYLRINGAVQPILAVFMVLNGALRGAGDVRAGLLGTVAGRWLVVVPLAWLLGAWGPLGTTGVWWALFLGIVVQASWVALRWRRGGWLEVALRRSEVWRRHLHRLDAETRAAFLDGVRTPAMAHDGTREVVTGDGVRYERDGEVVARWTVPTDATPEPVEGARRTAAGA